jgi:predicted metalloendopeptidase
VKGKSELPAMLAQPGRQSINVPFDFGIRQDVKDSTEYVVDTE